MKKILFILLAIFYQGDFLTSGQTANWSAVLPALFPTNVSGQIHGISRVSQMKFHPTNSSKMYAVSARGGLFISTNGGNNWTVTPGTDKMTFSAFASVCVDFTDDQIIYLGAGDHDYYYTWGGATGVWKSTNGGNTFTQTTLNNRIIVDMIMDPSDHNIIVAVTDGGIYKTLNGGTSWTLKSTARQFDDIKQRTPVSRMLYAATTDSAFFRSTDFGDTWSQITSGIVLPSGVTNGNGCRIAVTPADSNIVYLGMVANAGIIYKSTDGGLTFTGIKTAISPYLTYYDNLSTSHGQGDYNFGIGVDRVNSNILYLVAHNVWKSTDGGASWTQLTNWYAKVHTDMHQVFTNPYNNNQLYDMNDGGVWLSTDGGNNWTPKSDGIFGYEIYHGNCSPTRRDMISIGTQDNGELYSTTAGWFTNRGGDWGSQCAFDYRSNSSTVYYYQNTNRRSVTGGDQTYGLPANVTLLHDIAFNRSNSSLGFVADSVILRTTNLTAATPAWTQIASLGKKIMAMHSSFADANKLYVITSDQLIYVSTNALSATPTFTSYALPNSTNNSASITSIKKSPNTIYITCNTRVYRSTDNGVTWTNITYNLPSVNHVRIIADEYYSTNEMVFIASYNTVYYKIANALSWTIYDLNLPSRTTIQDMSIFNDSTSNTILRVSTYGRGMWETPITNLRALTVNFVADNTNPCPSSSVQFSDLSTGNVTTRSWTFSGGTPATSTAINPVVVYNSNGTYNVTLTVSDGTSTVSTTKTNYIVVAGGNLPLSEGFEGANDPPDGWINVDNGTLGDKWAKTSTAGGFGTSSNSMMFDNYNWNVSGERDELRVKRLDLTGYNSVTLTFDVAYQVFNGYSDSLAVLVSTDCGQTFTQVYLKGGSTLSTAGSSGNNFVPASTDWRTETLNLSTFAGQSNVIIEFQNINNYGNKLYIDNVNVNATVFAFAGADKNICSGNPTAIGSGSVSGVNYSWSPTSGLSSSVISNPIASPTVTTIYTLTVTQPNSGIFNRDTVKVTVSQSGGVAGVAIVANPSGTICQGTAVTFTATATNGGTPTYQWKKNGTSVGTNNSVYTDNSLVNSDQVSCIMTSSDNCVSGSPATSNIITMPVTTASIASVSISINQGNTICQGSSATFVATPVNGGIPAYQWKKNGTNFGINNAVVTTNSLVNGDLVSCIMTSTATCVTGSPATSNVISMTVNPQLTASVSIVANPTGPICQGTNVTFTASPVNGGIPTYQWKKNGTVVGTNSVSYSDNTLNNSDQITCSMTSTANCVLINPVTSNAITMTVNPNVNASVGISSSPAGAVCSGTNVTFTALPVNGGTPTYQWKKNNNNVGTNSPTYSDNTISNNDQILCIMTSNATCVLGSPATSNTVTMSVNPVVTASVTISANPSGTVCAGTNVSFNAIPVNGGTPSYQWKKNGSNVGINSSSYSDNSLLNSDQVTCVMTSNASCVSGSPATSNTITMTVTPTVTPTVTINVNQGTTICQGSVATFIATQTNGGTPSYSWKRNGTTFGINNAVVSINSLVNSDQIKCVMTSNAACVTGSPATSNIITMTVNPTLTASVSIVANPAGQFCQGSSVLFSATPVNGGSPVYQWKKNGTTVGTNSSSYSDNNPVNSDQVSSTMTSNASCVTIQLVNSNVITESVIGSPAISTFSPSSAIVGAGVVLTGSNFSGVTSAAINGIAASFNIDSPNQITLTVPALATNGPITVTSACGTGTSSTSFQVIQSLINVNLHLLIEGFYVGAGQMREIISPTICDTVLLELHASTFPYSLITSSKNTISTSGNGIFTFQGAYSGNNYYLVVKHRNSLETWSALPVLFNNGTISYDFSSSVDKAFGNNQKDLHDGNFAIFSGDVDQNGIINLTDLQLIRASTNIFKNGYDNADITGDNIVESADYSLGENNAVLNLTVIRP